MRLSHIALTLVAALALSACGSYERDISMRVLDKTGEGPDEFGILPSKPLQEPDSYTALPAPTTGQANRTDRNPRAEGIAALGGNPARLNKTGVPASDGALVRHASRNGVNPNVRAELAATDEKFRSRKSRFTKIRLFKQDNYAKAYKRQALEPYGEWYRYRRTGARTPAAPPFGE